MMMIARNAVSPGREAQVAYMNRLLAAAPKLYDLEHRWEEAVRIYPPHRRDQAMKAVIRDAWRAADVLRQMRMTYDALTAELREFDNHLEAHVVEAMTEIVQVVGQYLDVLRKRPPSPALVLRLQLCDRALEGDEEALSTVSDRSYELRQAADRALAALQALRVEVKDRLRSSDDARRPIYRRAFPKRKRALRPGAWPAVAFLPPGTEPGEHS
jgi:hypothetical protein